jgi:hypothetical protein
MPGWDTSLVAWLQELPSKSLFSSYLPGWVPGKNGESTTLPDYPDGYTVASFNDEIAKGYFNRTYDIVPNLVHKSKSPDKPGKTWYLCGHFIFGPAAYFKEVRQPDWILFWGEELYHSLLAHSYGWAVYSPPQRLLRHLYPQDLGDKQVPKIWVDFNETWTSQHDPATDLVIDAILNKTTGEGYFKDVALVESLYAHLGYDIGKTLDAWRTERKALH